MNIKSETQNKKKIRPIVWVLIALIIVLIGGGAFMLLNKPATSDKAAEQPAKSTAQTETKNSAPQQGSTSTPSSAHAETDPAKIKQDAAPTPRFTEAETSAKYPDLSFIIGPGGPIKTGADITNVHRRIEGDPMAIGAVDAPVVISDFSDLECPFCRRFANTTEKDLKKYIDEGKVRLEWNDMPVNGPNAATAAQAGRAAAAQGKFWEFQALVYEKAKDLTGHPNNKLENFVEYAKQVGIPDIEKFKSDITSGKYKETVENALQYASSLGVQGTPGFVVGNKFIGGAVPTDKFLSEVENQLKRVGR